MFTIYLHTIHYSSPPNSNLKMQISLLAYSEVYCQRKLEDPIYTNKTIKEEKTVMNYRFTQNRLIQTIITVLQTVPKVSILLNVTF
jgi:hypothetical protein